eukprot:6176594-Pleurochrysis_carterae.AAC.1
MDLDWDRHILKLETASAARPQFQKGCCNFIWQLQSRLECRSAHPPFSQSFNPSSISRMGARVERSARWSARAGARALCETRLCSQACMLKQ